jgi:lipoprotein-releasing system permease protein
MIEQMSLEYDIAKRYMRSRYRYSIVSIITIISIAGVTIGSAALIVVLSVMNGFEDEIRSRIIGTGSDIIVSQVAGEPIYDWPALIDTIMTVKGVVAVSPVVQTKCAIASRSESDGILVRGIIPEREAKVTRIKDYMLTENLTFETPDSEAVGIWLGVNVADRLNVGLYDKVKLFSLSEAVSNLSGFVPKAMACRVAGVFETGMYEYDANLAYIPLEAAEKLFNLGDGITNLSIKTDDIYKADKIAAAVDRVVGYRYYSTDWKVLNRNIFSWMQLEKWASFVTLSLIIAVAAFNIISSLIMVVLEKKRDIGVLISLGMTPSRIKKIFVYQGLTIGAIGSLGGSLLGFILCYLQLKFGIISLPEEYYFIKALPIKMQVLDFVMISLAAFLLSFLATVYPASRAAKLDPVEAIKYE